MALSAAYHFNAFPVDSDRLRLRLFEPGDIQEIACLMQDIHQGRLSFASALEKAKTYLEARDADLITLGLFNPHGRLAGRVCFFRRSGDGEGIWELGYYTHSAQRRRGYMSEALDALKPVFRDSLGAEAFSAVIHKLNGDSLSVMRRAGFAETGADRYCRYFRCDL